MIGSELSGRTLQGAWSSFEANLVPESRVLLVLSTWFSSIMLG